MDKETFNIIIQVVKQSEADYMRERYNLSERLQAKYDREFDAIRYLERLKKYGIL